MGKNLDLESAYKQLLVAPKHAHLAVFALKNPDTWKASFFKANALLFGASAAAHGFNRAAKASIVRIVWAHVSTMHKLFR